MFIICALINLAGGLIYCLFSNSDLEPWANVELQMEEKAKKRAEKMRARAMSVDSNMVSKIENEKQKASQMKHSTSVVSHLATVNGNDLKDNDDNYEQNLWLWDWIQNKWMNDSLFFYEK